ncbi:MAG: hypothetical protein KDN19_09395 [Verrucomicrobiae bacterium]|nr:hypothetical protein [Verrucomicrobiae bacterium]
MTTGGWIIMTISVATVTVLFLWSIVKVLKSPSGEDDRMHGFEFETPDEKTGHDPS